MFRCCHVGVHSLSVLDLQVLLGGYHDLLTAFQGCALISVKDVDKCRVKRDVRHRSAVIPRAVTHATILVGAMIGSTVKAVLHSVGSPVASMANASFGGFITRGRRKQMRHQWSMSCPMRKNGPRGFAAIA